MRMLIAIFVAIAQRLRTMHRALDELNAVEVTNLIACAPPPVYLKRYHLYSSAQKNSSDTSILDPLHPQASASNTRLQLTSLWGPCSITAPSMIAEASRLWGNPIGFRVPSPTPCLSSSSSPHGQHDTVLCRPHRSTSTTYGEHGHEPKFAPLV